jgi:uncharacterized membrane protein
MKRASDFRYTARKALSGKWGIAILAGLIASLLGGVGINTGSLNLNSDFSELKEIDDPVFIHILLSMLLMTLAVLSVVWIVYFIIGSIIEVGYNRFNLNLIDGEEVSIGQVVSYFPHWKKAISVSFLRALYTFLWSLLFIIPGIIASYSYTMATYIMAEHPEISASEALRHSKAIMYGNKWRLFCLSFSFIGWSFLCVFTLCIGYLWLLPYEKAAVTDFYREVSGTYKVPEIPADSEPTTAEV